MTIFLIGDPEKPHTFFDAEMVANFYGNTVLNPLNTPDIWEVQESMIDASDTVLLLKNYQKSAKAVRQYQHAIKDKSKKILFYMPKSNMQKELDENGQYRD